MDKNDLTILYNYNYWANGRILAAAKRVSPAQYTSPAGLSHGSLRDTLVHTLGVEILWRQRLQEGLSPASLLSAEEAPTLDLLIRRWQTEEQAMHAYLDSLPEQDLKKTIRYKLTKGIQYEDLLWKYLAHVVNHGTQTRSEAAIALTAYGQSPGDIDMINYFRGT